MRPQAQLSTDGWPSWKKKREENKSFSWNLSNRIRNTLKIKVIHKLQKILWTPQNLFKNSREFHHPFLHQISVMSCTSLWKSNIIFSILINLQAMSEWSRYFIFLSCFNVWGFVIFAIFGSGKAETWTLEYAGAAVDESENKHHHEDNNRNHSDNDTKE